MNVDTQYLIDHIDRLATMPKKDALEAGLVNVKAAAAQLSLDQLNCPLIMVAGTNGKGSSVAFLEHCYTQAGYHVGSYTSPHIHHFNERIKIDGYPVDNQKIADGLRAIEWVTTTINLSFFELTTLLAMYCFGQYPLDVIIAEVGLGGRLDAVNAWEADVALITSIDLDHQHYLGETRELIGREKAGIMRSGRPVICSDPNPPASIAEYAELIGARLTTVAPIHQATKIAPSNAAGCLAVLKQMSDQLPVAETIMDNALSTVSPPARLQHIDKGCDWVMDVAHNPASMLRLAKHLGELTPASKTFAIIGMCDDKDITKCLRQLNHRIDEWHLAPLSNPRGASVEKLSQSVKAFSNKPCYNHGSITQAVQKVLEIQSPTDRVVVCGSFFAVSEL